MLLYVRTAAYDASLSACLVSLYTASHSGTVECTAQILLDILPQTIEHSLSLELKVSEQISILLNFCYAFMLADSSVVDSSTGGFFMTIVDIVLFIVLLVFSFFLLFFFLFFFFV